VWLVPISELTVEAAAFPPGLLQICFPEFFCVARRGRRALLQRVGDSALPETSDSASWGGNWLSFSSLDPGIGHCPPTWLCGATCFHVFISYLSVLPRGQSQRFHDIHMFASVWSPCSPGPVMCAEMAAMGKPQKKVP
jgi:hypothetical protein